MYKVLLLGSGGRECAISWKLSQSPLLEKLYIAPGNAGTSAYGTNIAVKPTDFPAVAKAVADLGIDLVIAGNEDPLVEGVREYLAQAAPGVLVVGPGKVGAALEGSKDFAKHFMARYGIPTARYMTVNADNVAEGEAFLDTLAAPYVLKADGLAAGKGVLIISDLAEAKASLREMLGGKFGKASAKVVIEEFLSGIECSVFVLTDGTGQYRLLPPAKDYKRIGEGDTGLNTGGMGAVCPPPFCTDEFMAKVEERIVRPTLSGLKAEGIDYRGFIFLGLIDCGGEPMVIEYNVRMGDPETEAVMPRIASDLLPTLVALAKGNINEAAPLEIDPRACVTVMAVAGGYPEAYRKGDEITGNLQPAKSIVFHAGTTADAEGHILTAGGRVLTVSSLAPTIAEAAALSYEALADIHFADKYSRRDIAHEFIG
ncbi:MAG: phosphoribosylamine--glycine ligase [Bacteroidales bacterium]|nr:phosphoribosylamine--glycine ligase [Bacteroidales bacterium]MBD5219787.1 phosphoribosylamine--glycine ligase [Bacteroidales bacterium]